MTEPSGHHCAVAIVVAGGIGSRMGAQTPKQFLDLAGEPMLMHSLRAFDRHPSIDAICVVVATEHHERLQTEAPWTSLGKERILAAPGPERQDSVRNGLEAIRGRAQIVLVHDAARPLVTSAMIDETLEWARQGVGAIVARPVADTVKRAAEGGVVGETVDRSHLWRAETPQAFPFDLLWRAHERARESGQPMTDDAQAVESVGGEVHLCPAATPNPKITTPEDLLLAEALLAEVQAR